MILNISIHCSYWIFLQCPPFYSQQGGDWMRMMRGLIWQLEDQATWPAPWSGSNNREGSIITLSRALTCGQLRGEKQGHSRSGLCGRGVDRCMDSCVEAYVGSHVDRCMDSCEEAYVGSHVDRSKDNCVEDYVGSHVDRIKDNRVEAYVGSHVDRSKDNCV